MAADSLAPNREVLIQRILDQAFGSHIIVPPVRLRVVPRVIHELGERGFQFVLASVKMPAPQGWNL